MGQGLGLGSIFSNGRRFGYLFSPVRCALMIRQVADGQCLMSDDDLMTGGR